METQKIYLAGDTGNNGLASALTAALQNRGIDPSALALLNGGGFGGWGNNGLMDLVILFALFGGWGNGNGFGFGGGGNGSSNVEREMIMSAIQRNGTDLGTIASTLNCSVGQVQSGINTLASQICNLSAQNRQSAMQIINALQAGNQTLASQLSQCCCDNKLLATEQGYQNQIATANQTQTLSAKIDEQTRLINDKFASIEMREMQNKIDALREEKSTLQGTISNARQTESIQTFVSQAVAPVAAAVNALQSDVDGIKCKLPTMVSVPADKGVYLNQCTAAQLGLYGLNPLLGTGYGLANGSLWG